MFQWAAAAEVARERAGEALGMGGVGQGEGEEGARRTEEQIASLTTAAAATTAATTCWVNLNRRRQSSQRHQ